MIYTVTFNPAIDYVVHCGGLQLGSVNRTSAEAMFFGGKGINVSLVLRQLGVASCALGFTAGFTGEAIENGIASLGIKSEFIRVREGFSRINVKLKSGVETEINGQGPVISEEELQRLFDRLSQLSDGDTLVLAGSVPKSLPDDVYEQILARLSGRDIRIIVDASGELLRKVLKYRPFLIKPNDIELAALFETELYGDEDIIRCCKRLQETGARNVLVSMAEKGSLLLTESGEVYREGVCSGEVKNSVGAGDSMVAGFIAGLSEGFPYALKLGTACGGATAFSDGLAEKKDIDRLLMQL